MPRKETFHEKAMTVRSTLRLYVQHGAIALDGQSPQEFCAEVMEVMGGYADFRNIIALMASMDVEPKDAAKEFLAE